MQPDFKPLFSNPHLATIAGNFWKRQYAESVPNLVKRSYRISPETTIVALEQQPLSPAVSNIILLHGLEGSADAGYLRSFAHSARCLGYAVHRLNLRTCGGTESLCQTMYHAGLTSDVEFIIREITKRSSLPALLVGFSLGGNVALKLAGEVSRSSLISGVVAVSAPIDLATCVRAIDKFSNKIYAHRFLDRLRNRIKRKSLLSPGSYDTAQIDSVHSIWEFDHEFTAPLFGFGTAANYYATQSALNYIGQITIPTLLITAKDDPLVPFEIYNHAAIKENPNVELVATKHGGHIGFLSRTKPRFWVDSFALRWLQSLTAR